MAADESYPDELKYHPEHDWARVEGDIADGRGHLVRAGRARARSSTTSRPRQGSTVAKDESYGEVESVKAVSDLIAPLSGEVVEVNQALARRAGDDQRGSLRRGLARSRSGSPTRARSTASSTSDAYRKLLEEQ